MASAFNFDKNMFIDALSRSRDDYIYIHDFASGLTRIPKAMKEEFMLDDENSKNFVELWQNRIHEADKSHVMASYGCILAGSSDRHNVEYRILNRFDKWVWMRERGTLVRDGMGKPQIYIATVVNLGKKDNTDSITGLMNKYEFENYVNNCIASKKSFGIMILNIDDFKNINSLYGRPFGDYVLRATGQFINRIIPASARVFRLDGDEFGIVFIDHMKSDIKQVFLNINNRLSVQQEYDEKKYYCTMCAGCCKFSNSNNTYDKLVGNSHSALEFAKSKGKGRVVFFEPKLTEYKTKELTLTELLHESIDNGFRNFEVYCQPQVFSSTGRLKGGEALLRWKCDTFGNVPPMDFIPILEKTGMIIPVGKWVFEQSVKLCHEWIQFCPEFKMSINVSYIQLLDEKFLDFIIKTIRHAGLSPENIIVEFTESYFVTEREIVFNAFDRIREAGIQIAMDDFGTGYSSLVVLKEIPADIVKIDKAFVKNIRTSEFDRTFIRFVVELCHDVGIQVCLEGVERSDEYDIVSSMKIDFIQGYFFGKPHSAVEFYDKFIKR